ncbi:MAG: tyrosine recombinase [Clostridia bacterium]|nr:tyrosine recombinase [Clostridia bacterium]
MVKAAKEFVQYLHDKKRLSDNTCMSYGRDVEMFFEELSVLSDADICCITQADIQGYIDLLHERGQADATITRFAAALRRFFQFAMEDPKYAVTQNPMFGVEIPKTVRRLPQTLSTEDVFRLLSKPKCDSPLGYRDKAMLELMYATGISTSEIISVCVKDVDLRRGVMRCVNRKGERFVPLGKAAADAVRDYVKKARGALIGPRSEDTLFVNSKGVQMTRQGFWKIVKGYIREVGISDSVSPYTLRHSFAMHLLQNGADLRSVSEMLGHTDIVSTKIYAEAVNDNIRRVYQKTHPRA